MQPGPEAASGDSAEASSGDTTEASVQKLTSSGAETSTTTGYYTVPNTTNTATSADGAPFNQPFYILMNLAVGGTFSGNPTANTTFPQSLFIDYIRVYDLV